MRVGHLIACEPDRPAVAAHPFMRAIHLASDEAINVLAVEDKGAQMEREAWSPVSIARAPHGFTIARELDIALAEHDVDLLHLHGLRASTSIICRRWADATGRPYLVSPHSGLKDQMEQSSWSARLARLLWENALLAEAACLHAADASEANQMRALGVKTPLYITDDQGRRTGQASIDADGCVLGKACPPRTLLHFSPSVESAGSQLLMQAWGRAQRIMPDKMRGWSLIIAMDNHSTGGEDLGNPLPQPDLASCVHLVRSHSTSLRQALYRTAGAFVAPAWDASARASVIDAWKHGLPVLMADSSDLALAFEVGAALPIHGDFDALASGIGELVAMDTGARAAMGMRGAELCRHLLEPASELAQVYRWLLSGGPRPACVHVG